MYSGIWTTDISNYNIIWIADKSKSDLQMSAIQMAFSYQTGNQIADISDSTPPHKYPTHPLFGSTWYISQMKRKLIITRVFLIQKKLLADLISSVPNHCPGDHKCFPCVYQVLHNKHKYKIKDKIWIILQNKGAFVQF